MPLGDPPLKCTVYGLSSSEAPEKVRYVGQTVRNIRLRKREHDRATLSASAFPVNVWMRKVVARGFKVIMVTLEENAVSGDAEVWWVAALKAAGNKLVNATAGGPGIVNPSESTRQKIAALHRGKPKSTEHREKLRAFQTANPSRGFQGGRHTAEAKAKFTRKGSKHSAETKALMSAIRTGRKHSEATKQKIWQVRRAKAAERIARGALA